MSIDRMNRMLNLLLRQPIALVITTNIFFAIPLDYSTFWKEHVILSRDFSCAKMTQPNIEHVRLRVHYISIDFQSSTELIRFKFLKWNSVLFEPRSKSIQLKMFLRKILLWPRDKIRHFRWRFERATPFQKFEMIRTFADTIFKMAGIHVLSDCVWKWWGTISLVCAIQFTLFASYTTYYYWNENMITAIQPYAIMAMVIPVSILFRLLL